MSNSISCLMIKSFEVYKDKRRFIDNLSFNSVEVLCIKKSLEKILDINMYDIEINDDTIIGVLRDDLFKEYSENYINDLNGQLSKILDVGLSTLLYRNIFNVFSILDFELFNKGYCMDTLSYSLFSIFQDTDNESIVICNLLTNLMRQMFRNKLNSNIYFGKCME